tara:strand:- start:1066 stop:1656 length:591 start_codon:yes stop_codon:yes gene_type:complete
VREIKMSWQTILKKLKWNGTLSEENKKMLEREPKIKIDIPKLSYPKEEEEIPAILKIMEEKRLSPKEMKDTDLRPEIEMFNIVGAKKSDYEDLIKDVNYYTMTLKMKYQRPRPHQISDKIQETKTKTDDTPAFPSGHSMGAHALEKVLGKKYPDKKKQLKEMADKISLSRIQMGSHYPSDIKTGKQLGYLIGDNYE